MKNKHGNKIKAPDWVFWRAFTKVSSGKFRSIDFYSIDRLRAKFDRSNLSSINQVIQNFRIFQAIPHEFCYSSLIDLHNIKTQKLTKALENNEAKGLTNVNQGVQIHNIWHSSFITKSFSQLISSNVYKLIIHNLYTYLQKILDSG
jgi:hypothetical protein